MKATFRQLWGWPVALGVLSASGLFSALVSEGRGDVWSWFALGGPCVFMAWFALVRRGTSRRHGMTTEPSARAATALAADAAPLDPRPEDNAGGICLAELAAHQPTTITGLVAGDGEAGSVVRHRLAELGFMAGESICVLQRGPDGHEPIAVQVGDTVFALRHHEAGFVQVKAPQ